MFFTLLVSLVAMNGLSTEFIDSCARELGAKRLRLQLPWEGSSWETAFTNKLPAVICKPDWVDFPTSDPVPTVPAVGRAKLDRFNARRHLSEVSWVGAENQKHNLALQCWKVIVLDSTGHTELGRLLMRCIEIGKSDEYIWQVIADAFSNKSTATLKARASSLLAFGRWKRALGLGSAEGVFPATEEVVYEYLCDLRRMHAAPSKGKRFLEALGFAKGLLGADVEKTLSSARVRGVALGATPIPAKKKDPFTVEQVKVLERLAMFGTGQDAIFAGYLCFIIHCRLRWSDGQHCIREPYIDVHEGRGFIEAALYHHKTAMKRRTHVVRLLPVAGFVPGLTGLDWVSAWLEHRAKAGLRASMSEPTMPCPVSGGGWSLQPLTSSEASVWLRELLRPLSPTSLQNVATHSAKATILSWMSKANVSLSLRRLAGYHVVPGDKSALEYSRDAASPILRQIEAIFIAVRSGILSPDMPRSRRWSGAYTLEEAVKLAAEQYNSHGLDKHDKQFGMQCQVLCEASQSGFDASGSKPDVLPQSGPQLESKIDKLPSFDDDMTLDQLRLFEMPETDSRKENPLQPDLSDASDMSDSMSSSCDADSDSDDAERRVELDGEHNARDLVAPSDIAGETCYRHLKSKKLHLVDKNLLGVSVFKCGRKCNANYELLSNVPAFTAHGCLTCFGWSLDADDNSSNG